MLAGTALFGVAAIANAQSELKSEVSGYDAIRIGEVSVADLSVSEANRLALELPRNAPAVEQPKHRLPNGRPTSQPSPEMLHALPATEPNVGVAAAKAQPNFTSVKGFTGIFEGNNVTANHSELEPPDQGLAVHNNVAAEINNNVVRFFNTTTGAAMTPPMAASAFFNATGYDLTDTQVFYDPVSARWFFAEVMSRSSPAFEGFAVAVSKTSNPLGSYWIYHVRAFSNTLSGCQSQDCFPDYHKDGYDTNAYYITADLFSNVSGLFVESAIFALPKSKLEAGASFTYKRLDDPSDFVVQPSVPAPGEPFSTADNGSEFFLSAPGSARLSILAVINSNDIVSSISNVKAFRSTFSSQGYGNGTVPSTQPDVVGPNCSSVGVTSAPSLDGGYSAFQATVQKASGHLYGALAFGAKDGTGLNRDVIAWFEVAPALTSTSVSGSIVHQGVVTPANGYSISYPAFGLNKTGAGAMGMTITNKSASAVGGYPSAAVLQFTGTAPTGSITVSGPGFTSDDGFSGCQGPGPGQVGRWGDYAAATVDSDTGFFYTANEMIPNPTTFPRGDLANWGTFITHLHNASALAENDH